ncbi:CDP-diacylglycerol--serine O-phosphatidyltransferase [Bacteroidia bacterium]|nr:CDP-diacylglycerol--serine O-phosphatidyltransferase [Bacteroidia bacterium]GHT81819.1 CDP-diacylglycerol--serine O-phosphatidyltransferase [Bacteroidia bacterium]
MKLFTVPNIITSLNALFGCLSVTFAATGRLDIAFLCIIIAAVCDFFDGFAARLLHSYSAIGKELDSLADMISFGVAPAFMLFMVIKDMSSTLSCSLQSDCGFAYIIWALPFLLTVFSALRLAKFNVDERQTASFIGLPTPANALFFSTLALLYDTQQLPITLNIWWILALVVLFSYLLISEIPMFSLKIKDFSIKKYSIQIIFLVIAIILLTLWKIKTIPLIILWYIVLSIGVAVYNKIKINKL